MTLSEIRELLHTHALDHHADDILRLSLPAIRIEAHETADDALPIGASKFGGLPDVPDSFRWPIWHDRPLAFLAQFHLPDLAPYDVEHILPPTGTLSFFYEADTQPWGYEPSHRGGWSVLYTEDATPLHRVAQYPNPTIDWEFPGNSQILPHVLTFIPVITLPGESLDALPLTLSQEEQSHYIDVVCETNQLTHQLIGYPNELQGAMEGACERCFQGKTLEESAAIYRESGNAWEIAAAKQWRLLLQLDWLTNVNGRTTDWGLSGLIYFWIRRDHLAARDFSNVWLNLQCT